jgi:hypothetical protein
MNSDMGKWIMVAGAAIVLIGMIIFFFHDKLYWIGKLPGDIRIRRGNFRLFIPVTTMLLLSLVLTLTLTIIRKIFQ